MLELVQHVGQLRTDESGNDRRRCFVCAQTVVVARRSDASTEQICVIVDGFDRVHEEREELQVGFRVLARCQQVHACVGAQRPVVVLSGTVHTCEWLFVKQYAEIVLARRFFHDIHQQEVVVVGEVTLFEDRCTLILVRCYFVVTRRYRNSEQQRFHFIVAHKSGYTIRNGTEVVIVELLAFRRRMSEQRAAGHHQIGTRIEQRLVNEEVFLFPAKGCIYFFNVFIEVLANFNGSFVHSVQRFDQRHFVVERFTCIGNEDGRDTKRLTDHKRRRRWVPGCITTGFEGIADTTVREGRCIRFLLNEQIAVEFLDRTSRAYRLEESIVFFSCRSCKRLEPVCIVCRSFCERPVFHG